MGTQSEQLERKVDQTRARLIETLEELRAGITPGQVVDQFVDYARKVRPLSSSEILPEKRGKTRSRSR